MRRASVLAPAKVNLWLRVGRVRADGFHDIDTLFQAVDLCDEVEVSLRTAGATADQVGPVSLEVDGPDLGPVEENLAHRAARRFLQEAGLAAEVDVRLRKRIPAGAGLGGGSSDAAAVLRLLDHLSDRAVPQERLTELAAELGSDVPFFLCGRSLALASGRGEHLTAIEPLPAAGVVLVMPNVHVSTAGAYRALAEVRAGRPGAASPQASSRADAPASWKDVVSRAANDFELVVPGLHDEIARALGALRGAYPLALLSGSGAACFGLDPAGGGGAPSLASSVAELGFPTHLGSTLTEPPPVVEG